VGSDGSALLYFFYTFSSLLIARPLLRLFGAKRLVLFGLVGLLCYVGSFFIAVSGGANAVFLLGASIGGIGAGALWTGQGSYYSLNARAYALAKRDADSSAALANFASIFASTYLLLETLLKMFATIIYIVKDKQGEWKSIVFGLYVTVAFVSVVLFSLTVKNLKPYLDLDALVSDGVAGAGGGDEGADDSISGGRGSNAQGGYLRTANPLPSVSADADDEVVINLSREAKLSESLRLSLQSQSLSATAKPHDQLLRDILSVGKALCSNRRLQLLMPYQVCFGLSAGFVNSYMTAKVVAVYLGDGFIGLMSALATLTAVILAWPYARIATSHRNGKWYVMMAGGCCFLYSGLSVLCLSDAQMSSWPFLVSYFIIYGAARSAWESTNKAVVADYFGHDEKLKDSAFAAVYFMSGLAGAFGFVFYKFMSREQLAAINTVVPLLAIVSYHFSNSHMEESGAGSGLRSDIALEEGSSSMHRLATSNSL
jgi:MFS family permease